MDFVRSYFLQNPYFNVGTYLKNLFFFGFESIGATFAASLEPISELIFESYTLI